MYYKIFTDLSQEILKAKGVCVRARNVHEQNEQNEFTK